MGHFNTYHLQLTTCAGEFSQNQHFVQLFLANMCALNQSNKVMDMKRLPLLLVFKYDVESNEYSLRKEQSKK